MPAAGGRPGAPDPRIVARRIAVKRDEGRRRLRRLVRLLLAVTLVAAAGVATRTALLDVDHVRVEGADRVAIAVVIDAVDGAGAGRGEPLLEVRLDDVARAVEAIPAVADAEVERRWPGTVVVSVVERRPVAAVAAGTGVALVASDGVVVELAADAPAGMPRIGGIEADAEPGAVVEAGELLDVAAALPPAIAGRVEEIVAGLEPGEVALRLRDGGTARLGPAAELGAKLTSVATMLAQVDLSCLATLDVRVPSAPAVTRIPGCGR